MKRLNINEIKKIEFDILVNIAEFCEKNNITYYLSVGTLLGAVRHKGFIPWDDDIDVMMPRPDYNRFINEYNGDYKIYKSSEGLFYYLKVYDNNTVKYEKGIDYKHNYPIGVDVDIFPLDGSTGVEKEVQKQYRKACFLEMLLRLANQPLFLRKNPLKAINRIIPRIIGRKRIVKMIENNAMKYPYNENSYVIRMRRSSNGFAGVLPKSSYNPPQKIQFESRLFYVPKDYDLWLRKFYGDDYMKLPEPKKRKTHDMICYYR